MFSPFLTHTHSLSIPINPYHIPQPLLGWKDCFRYFRFSFISGLPPSRPSPSRPYSNPYSNEITQTVGCPLWGPPYTTPGISLMLVDFFLAIAIH